MGEYNKRNRTIQSIVDWTITLADAKGLAKITVNEIVNNVGIKRGTFYRYFNDKYDVITRVEAHILDQVAQCQMDIVNMDIHSIRKRLADGLLLGQIIDIFDQHRKTIHFLLSDHGDIHFINKLELFFNTMNYKTISKLNFTLNEKQKKIIAVYLTGTLVNLLKLHLADSRNYSRNDILKASYDLIRLNLLNKL